MTNAGTPKLPQDDNQLFGQDAFAAEPDCCIVDLKGSKSFQNDLQRAQGKDSHLVLASSVSA